MIGDQQTVEKDLVTDVMIGCDMWRQSCGKITDIQMFYRILTADEMMGMTTFSVKKLTGNIIMKPYTNGNLKWKSLFAGTSRAGQRNFL